MRRDISVFNRNVGPERFEAFDVLVHRAGTDRAPAGKRHFGLSEACEQRAEHQNRCTHRFN